MRCFFTAFLLRLKSSLRSGAFLVTAGFFLLLSLVLAAATPPENETSVLVGVMAADTAGRETAALLEENRDYGFSLYEDRAAMERDLLSGKLHCAYLLGGEQPVTALQTGGSYMRPLLDEVVLSAWFRARMPEMSARFLKEAGADGSGAAEDFRRLAQEAVPMTVTVKGAGDTSLPALERGSVQPLTYAVLVSAFLLTALLGALLADRDSMEVFRRLARVGGHPAAGYVAPVLADVALNFAVLLAADRLLTLFIAHPAYPAPARLLGFGLLAVSAAPLALAAQPLRGRAGLLLLLLPALLLVSVLCSGAVLNPALLPAGIGGLRFLSPAWYFLRLMSLLA